MLQDGNAKTTKQYNEIKMIKERLDVGLVMAFVMSTLYCHRISGFDTITGKHGYGYTDMENTGMENTCMERYPGRAFQDISHYSAIFYPISIKFSHNVAR